MKADEAKKLRVFMEREKLSQYDLADLIGKKQSDVSRYLSGKQIIPLTVWKFLHLKYGLRYEWIFHDDGKMKSSETEKKNLVKDINELNASIAMLLSNQERLRLDLNKMAADFYEKKHNK